MSGGLLHVAQRKRDAAADEAVSPSNPEAKPADNRAFFKPAAKPTAAQKAKSESRLADAIRKRDADLEAFSQAWPADK